MSLRYFVYCRKSSQGDSKQVASIADQESVLRSVERREQLLVADRFSESKSAKTPFERRVYRDMIERLMKGEADAILCWHINRLIRNEYEDGELRWLLKEGVIKCIKTPDREYLPEDHALLIAVDTGTAIQYLRDLKRDVDRGVTEKAQRGSYPYRPKAGYILDPFTKDLIPDPDRFALIQRAWQMFLSGSYSVQRVLEELNSWGYLGARTAEGGCKPMSRSSLYRLLNDKFYTGYFTFRGEELRGNHQPMITMHEFQAAQKLLGAPTHGKHQIHAHAFTGLIRCGRCGCLITAEKKVKRYRTTGTSRSYTYYHCTGRRGCTKHSVSEAYINEMIGERLTTVTVNPEFAEWALEVLDREDQEQQRLTRDSVSITPNAVHALERRRDKLIDLRAEGEITAEELAERKAKISEQIAAIREEIEAKQALPTTHRNAMKESIRFRATAHKRFISGDAEEKRSIATAFARRYVLTLGKLEIAPNPGLDRLRTFELQNDRDSQVQDGNSGHVSFAWRAMLDELRTAVTEAA